MSPELLRARVLVPITAPPVEDGAVLVSAGCIVAAGRWEDLRHESHGRVTDLGEVVLIPGLINAHCHLDYTHLAGHLPPPRSFTDWIQGVLALKAQWSFSEYAASWLAGAGQLLRSGCTTVVDFEAVPELLPEVWNDTPLRVVSALEMTGVRSSQAPGELLGLNLHRVESLRHARCSAALAPHAPYSTRPEFLALCATAARELGLVTTIHVAESEEEFDMFRHGEGAMFQWLRNQRDPADCGGASPVRRVLAAGFGGRECLLVHVNYLDEGDAGAIAGTGATVVHCPRSHDYFSHATFPWSALTGAGVNVCLGTDSLLTVRKAGRAVPVLDLRRELAAFSALHPAMSGGDLLRLVTVAPAAGLRRLGALGGIEAGGVADLVAFGFEGACKDAAESVVHGEDDVAASMIGGVWAIAPAEVEGRESES